MAWSELEIDATHVSNNVEDVSWLKEQTFDLFDQNNSFGVIFSQENLENEQTPQGAGFTLALQIALKKLNYDPGTIDGMYGANTKSAVRAFQTNQEGLDVDGAAGKNTLKKILLLLKVEEEDSESGESGDNNDENNENNENNSENNNNEEIETNEEIDVDKNIFKSRMIFDLELQKNEDVGEGVYKRSGDVGYYVFGKEGHLYYLGGMTLSSKKLRSPQVVVPTMLDVKRVNINIGKMQFDDILAGRFNLMLERTFDIYDINVRGKYILSKNGFMHLRSHGKSQKLGTFSPEMKLNISEDIMLSNLTNFFRKTYISGEGLSMHKRALIKTDKILYQNGEIVAMSKEHDTAILMSSTVLKKYGFMREDRIESYVNYLNNNLSDFITVNTLENARDIIS